MREWAKPSRLDALPTLRATCMAAERLELKVGAQVILLRNLDCPVLVNGSRGVVEAFYALRDNAPFLGEPGAHEKVWPAVCFENGMRVLLTDEMWSLDEWDSTSGKMQPLATIHQVPLRLAWALSIHKSQGNTFSFLLSVCLTFTQA